MFSPVKFNTGGYPDLQANVPNPYGTSLAPPTSAIENRGGPTFGLNSLSEPNTSPDVITVAAKLWAGNKGSPGYNRTALAKPRTYIKSGTPIAVCMTADSNPMTREGEPLHDVYVLNSDFGMRFDKDGGKHQNLQFLTVTVGDFWFEPNRVTYIAVAVQNVATVSIAPDQMRLFQTVGLGDRFYLKTKMSTTDTMLPFKMFRTAGKDTTADPALVRDHYVRVLTAVAPPIGNTIRCDMGNMLLVQ